MWEHPIIARFPLPEPFVSAAGVSQQCSDLPAVCVIPNLAGLTVGFESKALLGQLGI